MNENISLFDNEDNEADNSTGSGKRIDVVQMEFLGAEAISWQALFSGYTKLSAITYSSSVGFICSLLKQFESAEIIFGSDEVMSYSLQEVMAYQLKTIERLRENSSKAKIDLSKRLDDGSLRLYVARKKLSHEKIYLLENENCDKRTIMGSANMSYSAFTGGMRENICYVEGQRSYDYYMSQFEILREESTDNITSSAYTVSDDGENIDELPVMQTIKVKKALVIEPAHELNEHVKFALDVRGLAGKIASFMPKADKKGKIMLSVEAVTQTRRRIIDSATLERELRSEYPQLVVDVANSRVTLNDKPVDLQPSDEDIRNDAALFVEYMAGYKKFHGDVDGMQNKYFSFANWFFATPFMAVMRDMAVKYNQPLLPYPVFGLVYGKSKAGKTTFLKTLIKMMIGQMPIIAAPEFTRGSIDALKRKVMGAPIIVDDLTQTRFSQHAVETIKNDDFGVNERLLNYPAVVISANEDVKAVAAEITRRTVICHVEASLKNTELMQSNIVRRMQKNVGTAFYRAYLARMLDIAPELIEELKDDTAETAPDLLKISSEVICDLLEKHYGAALPAYMRRLCLDDYFSEKVTGSQVIKTICRAWAVNKKNKNAFDVNKKANELRYNAGQTWEADRIIKELPEDLEPHKSREWIVMDLERACAFFEVDFKKQGRFFGLF